MPEPVGTFYRLDPDLAVTAWKGVAGLASVVRIGCKSRWKESNHATQAAVSGLDVALLCDRPVPRGLFRFNPIGHQSLHIPTKANTKLGRRVQAG